MKLNQCIQYSTAYHGQALREPAYLTNSKHVATLHIHKYYDKRSNCSMKVLRETTSSNIATWQFTACYDVKSGMDEPAEPMQQYLTDRKQYDFPKLYFCTVYSVWVWGILHCVKGRKHKTTKTSVLEKLDPFYPQKWTEMRGILQSNSAMTRG